MPYSDGSLSKDEMDQAIASNINLEQAIVVAKAHFGGSYALMTRKEFIYLYITPPAGLSLPVDPSGASRIGGECFISKERSGEQQHAYYFYPVEGVINFKGGGGYTAKLRTTEEVSTFLTTYYPMGDKKTTDGVEKIQNEQAEIQRKAAQLALDHATVTSLAHTHLLPTIKDQVDRIFQHAGSTIDPSVKNQAIADVLRQYLTELEARPLQSHADLSHVLTRIANFLK